MQASSNVSPLSCTSASQGVAKPDEKNGKRQVQAEDDETNEELVAGHQTRRSVRPNKKPRSGVIANDSKNDFSLDEIVPTGAKGERGIPKVKLLLPYERFYAQTLHQETLMGGVPGSTETEWRGSKPVSCSINFDEEAGSARNMLLDYLRCNTKLDKESVDAEDRVGDDALSLHSTAIEMKEVLSPVDGHKTQHSVSDYNIVGIHETWAKLKACMLNDTETETNPDPKDGVEAMVNLDQNALERNMEKLFKVWKELPTRYPKTQHDEIEAQVAQPCRIRILETVLPGKGYPYGPSRQTSRTSALQPSDGTLCTIEIAQDLSQVNFEKDSTWKAVKSSNPFDEVYSLVDNTLGFEYRATYNPDDHDKVIFGAPSANSEDM